MNLLTSAASMAILLALILLPNAWAQESATKSSASDTNLDQELATFAEVWNRFGWNQPDGRRKYLRSTDDTSWQQRMKLIHAAAGGDQTVVATLVKALDDDDQAKRIVAAQALGFCKSNLPVDVILEKITNDPASAVKLYLVDALGMHGVTQLGDKLGTWRARNRDVKKHLAYAKERDGKRVADEVIESFANWDPKSIDSARVGQAAPDFELDNLTSGKIRLSDYRGKNAVVLTFIYGDT